MAQNSNVDWIPDFTMEYFFSRVYTKVQGVKTDLSKALKKIKPTRITRCMYVKGLSKSAKDNWKASKGIERKTQDKSKRKDTVKSQAQVVKESTLALDIKNLKANGLSIRKIAQQKGISVNTVQKYLKNVV